MTTRARKAAPGLDRLTAMLKNPHPRKAAQGGKGIDRRKIREMAERWWADLQQPDGDRDRFWVVDNLVKFGTLVARQVRLEERQFAAVRKGTP